MRNFELKKPRKVKQKQVKMKKVSQKRSNQIFLFGLAFFVFLCGLTMFISIKSAVKVNERLSNTAVVETKKETDRKLEQFLDGIVSEISTYISI